MVEVLTKFEAHARFPERGYDEYDPMTLIVGTRKELKAIPVQMKEFVEINGKRIPLNVHETNLYEHRPHQIDVDRPSDTRIIIWKD